jgi:uncharacterized RDD family membrane protein YckC
MSEQISTNTTSFGSRAMALAIDFALLAALYCFLFLLSAGWFIKEVINLDPLVILTAYSSYLAVSFVSFAFLHMVYFTVFHAWTGQTIGKMIMGIKVVTVGNRIIPPSVAFLRWSGYILSSLPLATGFLWSAVDKDHCAWHDRLAGTRVVTLEMT